MSGSKKCPTGTTTRVAYDKNGKKIHVKSAHIKRTCTAAKENAILRERRTQSPKKVFPKFDQKIHFRDFGYSTKKTEKMRHAALLKAAKKFGERKVLQHLNSARNYRTDPKSKMVMATDIKFLSIIHTEHSKILKKPISGSKTTKPKVIGKKNTPTKYNLFVRDEMKRQKRKYPGLKQTEYMTRVGAAWQSHKTKSH